MAMPEDPLPTMDSKYSDAHSSKKSNKLTAAFAQDNKRRVLLSAQGRPQLHRLDDVAD